MALVSTSVALIVENQPTYQYSGPVLTLGVPEVYVTRRELESWLGKVASSPAPGVRWETTDNPIGRKLGWLSAPAFFEALNLHPVVSIDIPGCEHPPDVVHDLNEPLPARFTEGFGVVVDPGTTEHIFDMHTALGNIVRALRVGGVVIHQVPIYMYNGGYYSINPMLLYDFYGQNGFADMTGYVIMWDRYRAYLGRHRYYAYDHALLGPRHALADRDQCRFSPLLLFIARKAEATRHVRKPVQSYEALVASLTPRRTDAAPRGFGARLSRIAYAALPFGVAFYLESLYRRHHALHQLALRRLRG